MGYCLIRQSSAPLYHYNGIGNLYGFLRYLIYSCQ